MYVELIKNYPNMTEKLRRQISFCERHGFKDVAFSEARIEITYIPLDSVILKFEPDFFNKKEGG